MGDMIFDLETNENMSRVLVDPMDATRRKTIDKDADEANLLIPIFRDGVCIYQIPDIHSVRRFAAEQINAFHPGIRRLMNPHE